MLCYWWAIRAGRRQSELHQFGEGRAKYFSTICGHHALFGGGALGVMEAGKNSSSTIAHEVGNQGIVIIILLFGLVVEGSSLRVAIKESGN